MDVGVGLEGAAPAAVDITAGTKAMSVVLIAAASRAGASVTYLRHDSHPAMNKPLFGSERIHNVGALLNLSLEPADGHTLNFKNLLGRNTEESFLAAYKLGNQLSYRHVLEWEEKQQYTSGLSGEHVLPLGGLTADWNLFYNENTAKEWATGYDVPAVQAGLIVKHRIPVVPPGRMNCFSSGRSPSMRSIAASKRPSMASRNPGMQRVSGVSGSTAITWSITGRARLVWPVRRRQLASNSRASG